MNDFTIVIDNFHSALGLVARQRKKYMPCEIIAASDFNSPSSLIKHLSRLPSERILFSWRGGLREALLNKKSRKMFLEMLETKTIHLLIPDLLGLEEPNLTTESELLNCTHGYWVTSAELFEKYSLAFPERLPTGIFHDLPNIEAIVAKRNSWSSRSGVIWVGNSKWGSNFGFTDHKGFNEIIKPLSRLKSLANSIKIIDSAILRMENELVLDEIARSSFLLQASESEGTGLPILEALGLGTVPITTKVGIAEEILTGEFASLIVDRNVESFSKKIEGIGVPDPKLVQGCIELFDKYTSTILREELQWDKTKIIFSDFEPRLSNSLFILIKWFYRYARDKDFWVSRKKNFLIK